MLTRVHKETKTRWSTEKYCLPFHLFKCVISKQYNICRISSINWYAKAIAGMIYEGFWWVFGCFFADALPRQTEKYWICLGILLLTYLAPEFWRLCSDINYHHWAVYLSFTLHLAKPLIVCKRIILS